MDQDKGKLAKVGTLVGIAVGLATIVSIGWAILHKENTEIPDYQKRVLATCEQVHGILDAKHEIYDTRVHDSTEPEDFFLVKKDVLLR